MILGLNVEDDDFVHMWLYTRDEGLHKFETLAENMHLQYWGVVWSEVTKSEVVLLRIMMAKGYPAQKKKKGKRRKKKRK